MDKFPLKKIMDKRDSMPREQILFVYLHEGLALNTKTYGSTITKVWHVCNICFSFLFIKAPLFEFLVLKTVESYDGKSVNF